MLTFLKLSGSVHSLSHYDLEDLEIERNASSGWIAHLLGIDA
jgi:hypothetical protein